MKRIGVILAAGRGRRMGRTKQLVPVQTADGDKPLVSAAYDAIFPICDEFVVVLGHNAEAVAAALGERAYHRAVSDSDGPMFESIRTGLLAAREIDASATVVLQPGDHPTVALETLASLVKSSLERAATAVIPQYGDRGGHPVLIPAAIVEQILEAECPGGLGQFWTDHPQLCFRLPVEDIMILRDVDTPGDLPH